MRFLIVFLAFLASVLAFPLKSPTKPSDDPFYSPPDGFESAKSGEVLRFRKMDNSYGALYLPVNLAATYQYLVKSENSFGEPVAIVTTLLVPHNSDPNKILSYQVAEDSTALNCAPSYALQVGSSATTIILTQIEFYYMQGVLNEGWNLVVPDYLGPNGANCAGYLGGKAVLNSIRGVLSKAADTGISSSAGVSLWGYSGGSSPTGWAAQLHPTYAPELNLIGAAYGGIIVNTTSATVGNMGKLSAGLAFTTLNGLANEYPELNDWIEKAVKPEKLSLFKATNSACLIQYMPIYLLASWSQYFVDGAKAMYDEVFQRISEKNNMLLTGLVPKIPIYLYDAKFDELLDSTDTDKLYDQFCAGGVSVEYHQDIVSEHLISFFSGGSGAFNWLKARHNGVPVAKNCQKKTSPTGLLSPQNILTLAKLNLELGVNIFGRPIGPNGPQ
ncbi:lipase 1 [[Candida] anglica]|uniref:Lipase 1 n=1 Tax=[Candida] anglica TaxID=148631 RepID=A0ABP0EIZ6_9ASCO